MENFPLLADRLKNERVRLGFSQADIAERTGVSREMWGKYEKADAKRTYLPNAAALVALDGLGADILYILTGRPAQHLHVAQNAAIYLASSDFGDDEKLLLQAYAIAPAGAKNILLNTARTILADAETSSDLPMQNKGKHK